MNASKFLISTAAAAVIVGAGFAIAQTTMPPASSPSDTAQTSPTQSTPPSPSTDSPAMSTERDARADRN